MFDSNWIKMADWRFQLLVLLVFFGDSLAGLGILSLAHQLYPMPSFLFKVILICGHVGIIGLISLL